MKRLDSLKIHLIKIAIIVFIIIVAFFIAKKGVSLFNDKYVIIKDTTIIDDKLIVEYKEGSDKKKALCEYTAYHGELFILRELLTDVEIGSK